MPALAMAGLILLEAAARLPENLPAEPRYGCRIHAKAGDGAGRRGLAIERTCACLCLRYPRRQAARRGTLKYR